MKFLKDYKKGGDRREKVDSMRKAVYISKKNHQDFTARVVKGAVKESKKPSREGAQFFILEVEPVEFHNLDREMTQATKEGAAKGGAQQLEVGRPATLYIDLSDKQNNFARDYALEEFVRAVAACVDEDADKLLVDMQETAASKQSEVEKILVDDLAKGKGNLIRIFTGEEPSKGWYNLNTEAATE